jgi:hypothetical protein
VKDFISLSILVLRTQVWTCFHIEPPIHLYVSRFY